MMSRVSGHKTPVHRDLLILGFESEPQQLLSRCSTIDAHSYPPGTATQAAAPLGGTAKVIQWLNTRDEEAALNDPPLGSLKSSIKGRLSPGAAQDGHDRKSHTWQDFPLRRSQGQEPRGA